MAAMLIVACGAVMADPAPAEKTAPQPAAPAADAAASAIQNCPEDFGTRIVRQSGQCQSSPVRVYGADEIRSTGAVDAAGALRQMDPAIAVTR